MVVAEEQVVLAVLSLRSIIHSIKSKDDKGDASDFEQILGVLVCLWVEAQKTRELERKLEAFNGFMGVQ